MHVILMLLLAIACMPKSWPHPLGWYGEHGRMLFFTSLTLTWAIALNLVAASYRLSSRTCRNLRHAPEHREEILARYARRRRRLLYALFAFIPLSVYGLGWGWTAQRICTFEATGPLPGVELLVLAPFLFTLILSWIFYYDVERAIRQAPPGTEPGPFLTRWSYVIFNLRQNLAFVGIATILLVVVKTIARYFPWLESAPGFGMLALVPLLFGLLPLGLRFALGLRSLPPGPLRDRLDACARRLGFQYRDILVWNIHGTIANAMVAGLMPFLRYVILTDYLISELTPDEIEAVFGHELGHIRHQHMFFYMGFLLISLVVLAGLWSLAIGFFFPGSNLADDTADFSLRDLQLLPLTTIMGAYVFVVFGFLSRRCERQADIFGCRAVSCSQAGCAGHEPGAPLAPEGKGLCATGIRTFIHALEKVGATNDINRKQPGWLLSWQHSTIARRVDFLQRLLDDPSLEARFQRSVFAVKWGVILTLGAVLCYLGQAQGWSKLGF